MATNTSPRNLIIIQCAKTSKPYECPAKEMYWDSPLFRKSWALAERIGGDIYILSTKYGLIKPTEIIGWYDFALMGTWYELGIKNISKETRRSIAKHRRQRNKILEGRLLTILQKQTITNVDYDNTYVMCSEYFVPTLERSVLLNPYINLYLGGVGIFAMSSNNYLWNQYDRLNSLPLGYRKNHVKWYKENK